jgi:hypothetical protein
MCGLHFLQGGAYHERWAAVAVLIDDVQQLVVKVHIEHVRVFLQANYSLLPSHIDYRRVRECSSLLIATRRIKKAGDPPFSTHRVGVAEDDLLQLDRAVRVIEPVRMVLVFVCSND